MKFVQVPREGNEHTDHLAKAASEEHMTIGSQVLSFIQYSLAINEVDIQAIPTGVDWMAPIVSYIKN